MGFKERLEILRRDKGLKQQEVAKIKSFDVKYLLTGEKETSNLNQKEKHILETFQEADPKLRDAILTVLSFHKEIKLNIDVRALLSIAIDSIDE